MKKFKRLLLIAILVFLFGLLITKTADLIWKINNGMYNLEEKQEEKKEKPAPAPKKIKLPDSVRES